MNKNTTIPIFFACDQNFIPYTIVSMKSLIENASGEFQYHIYILSVDIPQEMKETASRLADDSFTIEFVDMTKYLGRIESSIPLRDYYSKTTYFRIYIPEMFPQYDKAIYIDSDTIVLGDISKLYAYPLGKCYAGVIKDQVVIQEDILGEYVEKVLGIDRYQYFNAGVMLMNCQQFREEHLLDEFVEMLHVYTFVVAQDQDYLNLICRDKVLWLGPEWNCEVFGELPCKEEEIQLLHYNMAAKPWHYADSRLSGYFWDYAKKTECYEQIRHALQMYTEEERKRDSLSGEHLIQMAISEINNENNYLRQQQKASGQSVERLKVLEKIAEYEKAGRFDEDVEEDPPAPVLMPEDINYLPHSIKSMVRTRYAYKFARWFVAALIKKRQLVIKEIVGVENFQNLDSGAIVTCNHFNAYDSFAMQIAYEKAGFKKRRLYRVIREGNYTGFPGFYGFLMRNCNTLPLSSNFKTMEKFILAVDQVLKKGNFVLVYPEQSMWWNYRKPKPLKKGAFTFAARNQVPVVPCFITMSDSDILDNDGFHVQEYTIHIGAPIYPDSKKSRAQNVEEMRRKNFEVWKQIYEETYRIPLQYTCEKEIG